MKNYITLFILFISLNAFAQQKTDFSGNWLINTDKTDFGEAPERIVPKTIKVDQQAGKIIISKISLNDESVEQAAVVSTLSFDGTPFSRTQANGPDVVSILHWLDNKSFTISIKGASTATETWSLADNGKTLSVNRAVEQANGLKYSIKAYYDKQ